jgi:hypothetical protein
MHSHTDHRIACKRKCCCKTQTATLADINTKVCFRSLRFLFLLCSFLTSPERDSLTRYLGYFLPWLNRSRSQGKPLLVLKFFKASVFFSLKFNFVMRLIREYIPLTMLISVFFKSYILQSKIAHCLKIVDDTPMSVTIFRYFLVHFRMIF